MNNRKREVTDQLVFIQNYPFPVDENFLNWALCIASSYPEEFANLLHRLDPIKLNNL